MHWLSGSAILPSVTDAQIVQELRGLTHDSLRYFLLYRSDYSVTVQPTCAVRMVRYHERRREYK